MPNKSLDLLSLHYDNKKLKKRKKGFVLVFKGLYEFSLVV